MIEITIDNMLSSLDVLKKVSEKSFPAKIAFQIARILREIDRETDLFYKQRENLIRKYCKYDENGEIIFDDQERVSFTPENQKQLEYEITNIIKTTIHINAEPIKMKDLENINFTPNELKTLIPYLEV